MAVSTTAGVIHVPFSDRAEYSSPYPLGIAVAHADLLGDATGGLAVASFLADGQFLYRLEGLNTTVNEDADTDIVDCITSHGWATRTAGLGTAAFDLNWVLIKRAATSPANFAIASLADADLRAISRLPMGRTDKVALQTIMAIDHRNTDTRIYDFDAWWSYWPATARSESGFLQSFYEAPVVAR